MDQLEINGSVAPGFESLRALFEKNLRTLNECSNQLCIYHRGEKVVDLWASVVDDKNFGSDSIANIFSSGKSFEAIAMAYLVDQGLLDYASKITDYWPEFGANGKGSLVVADLMRHEAGLAGFNVAIDPTDLLTENIKKNKIGKLIESHPPAFRVNGTKREYHTITRGWIANELFRRVDKKGRTIGQFIQEEISIPMGADVMVGVKADALHKVVDVVPVGILSQFLESLKPAFMGRRTEKNIFQLLSFLLRIIPKLNNRSTKGFPTPLIGMRNIGFFNNPMLRKGETPSANTHASARGLAKIASMMSQKGRWHSEQFISEDSWNAMHGLATKSEMGIGTITFTQGGVAQFANPENDNPIERALNIGREGFYGWMGLGGSIFQWHPEHEIGFAYIPTSLNVLDLFNERGKTYQSEVLHCMDKLIER